MSNGFATLFFRYWELVGVHGKLDPLVSVDLRPEKRVQITFTCGDNSEVRTVDVYRLVPCSCSKLKWRLVTSVAEPTDGVNGFSNGGHGSASVVSDSLRPDGLIKLRRSPAEDQSDWQFGKVANWSGSGLVTSVTEPTDSGVNESSNGSFPPARWTDDLLLPSVAGSNWMAKTGDRILWRLLGGPTSSSGLQ